MGKILIIHSGLSGISNACIALAKRLQADNHRIWISAIRDQQEKTEANDIDYLAINPIVVDYRSRDSSLSKTTYFDSLINDLDFDSFSQMLEDKEIDLVLIDMELHEYIMYLSSIKAQFVLLSQWFSIWKDGQNLPPSSTALPKPKSNHRWRWMLSSIQGRLKTLLGTINRQGFTRRHFILYLAETLDFDKRQFISYQFPLPFSYTSLPTLMMVHPELEFASSSLPNLQYCYPQVAADRIEIATNAFEEDFQEITSRIQIQKKRLIVVTISSMDNSKADVLPTVISVLGEREDCVAIISAGRWYDEFASHHELSNIYIYKHIPQVKALRQAHLSINHGGIHTINECIHFKIPMLILSGGQYDQNGCGARINHNGCGVALPPNQVTTESIKNSINQILNTPDYQQNIEKLHQSYVAASANRVLENIVNTYLD